MKLYIVQGKAPVLAYSRNAVRKASSLERWDTSRRNRCVSVSGSPRPHNRCSICCVFFFRLSKEHAVILVSLTGGICQTSQENMTLRPPSTCLLRSSRVANDRMPARVESAICMLNATSSSTDTFSISSIKSQRTDCRLV